MRKSTSIFKVVLIALFVVSLGIEMVSAAGFPSVKELYGRYKFSGECSYVDMAVSYTHLTLPTILLV